MKYLIILLSFLLAGCTTTDKPINTVVEKKLKELLSRQKDCDYSFSIIGELGDLNTKDSIKLTPKVVSIGDPSSSWYESDVVNYCLSNKKEVYPILIKMIENSEYEWTGNLLLYRITGRPADSLIKYEQDKCAEWKLERKQKDIDFWKNHPSIPDSLSPALPFTASAENKTRDTISSDEVEQQLKKLIERKKDCEYYFRVSSITAFTGNPPEGRQVKMVVSLYGNNDLGDYCDLNEKKVYPILLKMLKESDYAWVSNLLLYRMTGEPADDLMKYETDKCEDWKKERRQKDVKFWTNYKPEFVDQN
jgi:hypothetical protein